MTGEFERTVRPPSLWKAVLACALVVAAVSGGASAEEGNRPDACRPPRCRYETIKFRGYDFKVTVLVPSDYTTAATQRYPVWYLLHGGEGDETTWLGHSDVDAFTADKPVIVVMPAVTWAGLATDWEKPSESFLIDGLIPHIDATYRTIPGRAFRAIAGLSGGGGGTMHIASRHPDQFVAAGGFSGNPYDLNAYAYSAGFTGVAEYCAVFAANDLPGLCHGVTRAALFPPYGDPVTDEVAWHGHNATDLATNLRGMTLFMAVGNGIPCDSTDVKVIATSNQPLYAVEDYSFEEAVRFDRVLNRNRIAHEFLQRPCGIHHWRYWDQDLRTFWTMLTGPSGFGSAAPASFEYRSPDARFSQWGWTVAADPRRAAEFMDLTGVSCRSLRAKGSGLTTVTTQSCFAPNAVVRLSGAVESTARADGSGALSFHIDLGPAHMQQQYTPAADVLEASRAYWVTRDVTIETGRRS